MERSDIPELGRLLSVGHVPSDRPLGVVASYGNGENCAICGKRIVDDEGLYTVRWMKIELDMHLTCFDRWERVYHARADGISNAPNAGKGGGMVARVHVTP